MGYQLFARRADPALRPVNAVGTGGPEIEVEQLETQPLWRALLRAAGLDAEGARRAGWLAVCQGPAFAFEGAQLRIHLAILRDDIASRANLWRTLRALRRTTGDPK